MEHARRTPNLLRYEVIGFGSLIAMYWLVELPVVPRMVLGVDAPALWDQVESVLLTVVALLVAGPTVVQTRRLHSRVRYLERLLRADPRTRGLGGSPDGATGEPIVATLGDGTLTVAWRFALDDWVQSILHPDLVGRVVAGRASRTASGSYREDYEIEVEGGFRFLVEGDELRFAPLCDGRPMRFVGARQSAKEFTTLVYRCSTCGGTTELVL